MKEDSIIFLDKLNAAHLHAKPLTMKSALAAFVFGDLDYSDFLECWWDEVDAFHLNAEGESQYGVDVEKLTPFQRRVFDAMSGLPLGVPMTEQQLAQIFTPVLLSPTVEFGIRTRPATGTLCTITMGDDVRIGGPGN